MDFTPELTAFQGVIISADNIYSFSKITTKGGNEDKINCVINSISQFLKNERFITDDGIIENKIYQMRKFALFIILNADLPALEEMVERESIDFVIWTIPTITKCLMSEMFWRLYLDRFVYEIIAYVYPQLAIEAASSFIVHIQYFTPMESLNKVKIICSAIYKQICRLHFFKFENDMMANILMALFNNFYQCLNYFTSPPNPGKLETLTKDQLYKFKGDCLSTAFCLITDCITNFTAIQEFAPLGFDEIYLLTYRVGTYIEDPLNFVMCDTPNKSILDCLEKCNIALLDRCKDLVMDVSVDIFCAWSEFEENGKSMQESIGEEAYKLRMKILEVNSISEHPLISMIEQIARKPVNVEEIINNTDNDTIIYNINTDEGKKASWVRALINKEQVCIDKVLVQQLIGNLNILNEEDCQQLYRVCSNHLKSSTENTVNIKMLSVKSFAKCNFVTQLEILDDHFSDNCFHDYLETPEFDLMMTEVFNKLIISAEADTNDILSLFLCSPQKVYMKIFKLASENSQQTEIMLKGMKLLEKYSSHYYKDDTVPCIIRLVRNVMENCLDTEKKQHNFVTFICGLKAMNVISGAKLLLFIIMPSLYEALINKILCIINVQCCLLKDGYSLEELIEYRAPMLAMLAQVLDVVRWKINTFQSISPSTLQIALDLQIKLYNTYCGQIPDKEANWLKSKLKNMQPLNLYYYSSLWNVPGNSYIEIVSGKTVTVNTNMEQLAMWLSQVLCSTNQKEWCEVWDSLHMFSPTVTLDVIHDALSLLAVTEIPNRTSNTLACLLNCYRNFVYIIRYKYFKEPLSDDQISTVTRKIALTVNVASEDSMEDIATVFLPLFSYMVDRKNDYSSNVPQLLRNSLKYPTFANIVNKVFANGTA